MQEYKGIWYAYLPSKDAWIIADRADWSTACVGYYSNNYRIDEAIEHFKKEFENE